MERGLVSLCIGLFLLLSLLEFGVPHRLDGLFVLFRVLNLCLIVSICVWRAPPVRTAPDSDSDSDADPELELTVQLPSV